MSWQPELQVPVKVFFKILEMMRIPVRQAFSYGIRHAFIVIKWSVILILLNHNENMSYPVWKSCHTGFCILSNDTYRGNTVITTHPDVPLTQGSKNHVSQTILLFICKFLMVKKRHLYRQNSCNLRNETLNINLKIFSQNKKVVFHLRAEMGHCVMVSLGHKSLIN